MREIDYSRTLTSAYLRVATIPSADVVEVKHGRWIHINFTPYDQCSICGKNLPTLQGFKYCPNCGSKMDGDLNG